MESGECKYSRVERMPREIAVLADPLGYQVLCSEHPDCNYSSITQIERPFPQKVSVTKHLGFSSIPTAVLGNFLHLKCLQIHFLNLVLKITVKWTWQGISPKLPIPKPCMDQTSITMSKLHWCYIFFCCFPLPISAFILLRSSVFKSCPPGNVNSLWEKTDISWMSKYWAGRTLSALRWNTCHKMKNCSKFLSFTFYTIKRLSASGGRLKKKKECFSKRMYSNCEGTSGIPPVDIAVLPVDLLSPSGGFYGILQFIPAMTLKEF